MIAPAVAQEAAVDVATLPQDPAFDRYVDMDLLADAWEQKDASLLTDLALTMAEGERILQRPRRGIAASDVFGGAIKSAAELRDAPALARLTSVLGNLKRDDLLAQATTARRLASASRAMDPGLTVQADTATPAAFFAMKSTLEDIASAKIAGDRAELREISKDIADMPDLSEAQRRSLSRAATEALEVLPSENDPASSALNKLLGESRRGGGGGGRSSGGGGGRSGGLGRSSGMASRSSGSASRTSSSRVGSSASRTSASASRVSGSSASRTSASNSRVGSGTGRTSGGSGTTGTASKATGGSGSTSASKSSTGSQGSTTKGTGGNSSASKSTSGHISPTGSNSANSRGTANRGTANRGTANRGTANRGSSNRGTANRNGGRDHGGRDHGPRVRLDRHNRDLFRHLNYITGRRSFIYSGRERLYFGDYYLEPGDEILSVGSYCCCNTRFNLDQLIDMATDDGDPVMTVRDGNSGELVDVSLDDSGGGSDSGGDAPDAGGGPLLE
jgi:hypothetical protein